MEFFWTDLLEIQAPKFLWYSPETSNRLLMNFLVCVILLKKATIFLHLTKGLAPSPNSEGYTSTLSFQRVNILVFPLLLLFLLVD